VVRRIKRRFVKMMLHDTNEASASRRITNCTGRLASSSKLSMDMSDVMK
jgi:hypothetical protein